MRNPVPVWTTSIKAKFLIAAAALILVLGLAMILLAETFLRAKLHEKLEKRGLAVARSVARNSIDPLLTERYVELALIAKEARNAEEDIEYIFITNSRGDVVAHTFEGGFPAQLKRLRNGNGAVAQDIKCFESEKGQIHDILVPLVDGRAGAVHLGLSEAAVRKDIDEINRVLVMAVVGLMAFGGLLSIPVATSITKPIHKLSLAAKAIGRGDLSARVPVHSDDEVGQLAGVFNEMAELRMRAETVLAASEKKLRDITASLGEGVMVLDEHSRLVFMNPEAEHLLGWREEEMKGKEIHGLIHYQKADGSVYPDAECPSCRVILTGERTAVEDEYFIHKEGKRFPVSFVAAPVFSGGTITSVVVSFRDITLRKQNDAEREQLLLAYQDAVENINTLRGLLPICSSCKRIRDDKGYWNNIEVYVRDHSEAEFSHGICPECAEKLYPGYYKKQNT